MRRSFAVVTVLALALGLPLAPSGAASRGGRPSSSAPELEQRARDEAAQRLLASLAERDATATETSTKAGPSVDLTGTTDAGPAGTQAPSPSSSGGSPKFDAGAGGAQQVPNEWVVALQPFADPDEAEALARGFGGDAEERFRAVFEGFVFRGPEVAARRLAEHPRVRKVTANGVVEASADSNPTGVRRIQADQARAAGATGSGQRVAILDTGIDLDHPDLNANIEASRGKNCVSSGRSTDDDNGHGTHVAGIVAAEADGSGVVGVAPGAKLVPVKVLGSNGSGSFADVICGIDHVVSSGGIGVINLSLGGPGSAGSCGDGFVHEAICEAVDRGIVVVVAAGNGEPGASDPGNASDRIPARFPEVIAVSALDDRDGAPGGDRFASFSKYGSVVDVIAPGTSISSTRRGGGTTTMSGTSMAAPHAAGAAALALADGVSPGGVRNRLIETGECPNGTTAGGDRTCSGQGSWSGDRESRAEPLVNALRATGEGQTVTPPIDDPGPDQPGQGSAPTVSISDPDGGATVTGTVTVRADANDAEDARGTLRVTFQIDGTGTVRTLSHREKGEYTGSWTSTTVGDGAHTIVVTATDSDGNATSRSVSVTVGNGGGGGSSPGPDDPAPQPDPGPGGAPTVRVVQPGAGASVGGKETIRAEASDGQDPAGSLGVRYQVDGGAWVAMAYSSSNRNYQGSWRTDQLESGNYTIRVQATDSDGNVTTSSPVTVEVRN